MAAVTLAQLRRLARLHREGVTGAGDQLDALIEDNAEEMAGRLGASEQAAMRLRSDQDRVELLVRWLDDARRRHAERRARDDHDAAARLASEVYARRGYGGELHLDRNKLHTLSGCRSFDWLAFDADVPRGLDRSRLRRIMRSLESTDLHSVVLDADKLHLGYETARSRGRFDLALQAIPPRKSVLYVPAFETSCSGAAEEIGVVHPSVSAVDAVEAERSNSPTARPTRARSAPSVRRPRRPVLRRFLDLASEALS